MKAEVERGSEDEAWKWSLEDFVDDEPNSGWFPITKYIERESERERE